MRTPLLLLSLIVVWGLLGATCLPLNPDPAAALQSPTNLGVTIQTPTADATVPDDAVLEIRWTAHNDTTLAGSAKLYVESRTDLTQTTLAEDIAVNSGSVTTTTSWDVSDFERGVYVIYAQVSTSADTQTVTAPGRITIDAFPSFDFLLPGRDRVFENMDSLTISWTGADPEGAADVTIGLDPDSDHQSGNEVFIHETTLDDSGVGGSIDWTGDSLLNKPVKPGKYLLFAFISDAVNPERAIDDVYITIPEPAEEEEEEEEEDPVSLGITQPDEDTTFIPSEPDASLEIQYTVNESDDVLIDIIIDTDDNHSNGNEETILPRRLVTGGTESGTFDWDGTYANGDPVPPGIYSLVIVMNSGGGSPRVEEGTGLVFLRAAEDQPLIALLKPDQRGSAAAGEHLTIKWRDDDPNEQAQIRIAIDDDDIPDQGEDGSDPDDMAELIILEEWEASGDDVQDSLHWRIPGLADLGPGTYYIFAYIDPAEEGDDPQISVGPVPFIVQDPTN